MESSRLGKADPQLSKVGKMEAGVKIPLHFKNYNLLKCCLSSVDLIMSRTSRDGTILLLLLIFWGLNLATKNRFLSCELYCV